MTKIIFMIGAGRSASSLIQYLLNEAESNDFKLIVGDKDLTLVNEKISGHKRAKAISFDVFDKQQRVEEILKADIVISMLPANLHFKVAQDCVKYGKNLVTASYVSDEIKSLDSEAKQKGVLLLNEIGLDPGIDHMSAMKIIDSIKAKGGELTSFKSYCGGLVAPEFDTNPWSYKFTWNPRNVVLAGQGTAQYIESGKFKYIPYGQLFKRTVSLNVLDYGTFEAYANRDSLSYREIYKSDNIQTVSRGTLRRPGYGEAWNVFVQLGLADDSFKMDVSGMTYKDFFCSFMDKTDLSIEDYLAKHFGASPTVFKKIEWLGILNSISIDLEIASPAEVLQKLLEVKWVLATEDKDMIVMQHQFEYMNNGKKKELH